MFGLAKQPKSLGSVKIDMPKNTNGLTWSGFERIKQDIGFLHWMNYGLRSVRPELVEDSFCGGLGLKAITYHLDIDDMDKSEADTIIKKTVDATRIHENVTKRVSEIVREALAHSYSEWIHKRNYWSKIDNRNNTIPNANIYGINLEQEVLKTLSKNDLPAEVLSKRLGGTEIGGLNPRFFVMVDGFQGNVHEMYWNALRSKTGLNGDKLRQESKEQNFSFGTLITVYDCLDPKHLNYVCSGFANFATNEFFLASKNKGLEIANSDNQLIDPRNFNFKFRKDRMLRCSEVAKVSNDLIYHDDMTSDELDPCPDKKEMFPRYNGIEGIAMQNQSAVGRMLDFASGNVDVVIDCMRPGQNFVLSACYPMIAEAGGEIVYFKDSNIHGGVDSLAGKRVRSFGSGASNEPIIVASSYKFSKEIRQQLKPMRW